MFPWLKKNAFLEAKSGRDVCPSPEVQPPKKLEVWKFVFSQSPPIDLRFTGSFCLKKQLRWEIWWNVQIRSWVRWILLPQITKTAQKKIANLLWHSIHPFFCFVRRSWVLPPRFNQMGVPIWRTTALGSCLRGPSTIGSPIIGKFMSKTLLLLWGLCILSIKFGVNPFDQKIYPPKNYETSKLIIFKEPICKWFFQCHQKMDSVHSAWCVTSTISWVNSILLHGILHSKSGSVQILYHFLTLYMPLPVINGDELPLYKG